MISLLLGASAAFVAPLASRSAISRGGAVQMAGDGTVVKNVRRQPCRGFLPSERAQGPRADSIPEQCRRLGTTRTASSTT